MADIYGFTELRTYDDRYVISTLLSDTGKPQKHWASFVMNSETIDGEVDELANWDNRTYLIKTLYPLLKKVAKEDITMKKFYKILNGDGNMTSTIELFPTEEDVVQVFELFTKAIKWKLL